jgi:nucleoid-associated protein YgaU
MINRYKNRRIVKNDFDLYENIFKNKNVKYINQYTSPEFSYVNSDQYANLNIVKHVWQEGDRYYKLSEKYYGDSKDWWIIAKFNQKPTESHVQVGDIINVPLPLDLVLNYMTG